MKYKNFYPDLIKESSSGFSRPTYWFHEDFGMKIGIELKEDGRDPVRKSLANTSKSSRISPWLNEVKNRLIRLKYQPFPLDMVFNYRDFEDEHGHVGYATYHSPSDYYISLNINYLSGKIAIKTVDSIDTIIHEWAHIWFFLNETDDMRRKIKTLLKNLRGDSRKLLPYGPAEEYALSDDDGDELWAYMNTHYFKLSKDVQDAYWKIRDHRKESHPLPEDRSDFNN